MTMYDPALQWAVLRLLGRWGALPLSDLLDLLDSLQRPHFRDDLLKDMEWEGLLTVRWIGDEHVLEITPRGRAQLSGQTSNAPPGAEV